MIDHSLVETEDGSPTLYSAQYDENYHSISGAYNEALHKFVNPSNVLEKAKSKPVKILDVCFGLGYNSFTTLEMSDDCYPIEITALEKYKSVIQKSILLSYPFKTWNQIMDTLSTNHETSYKKGKIKLHYGDAREIVQQIDMLFDVIYLDPFSTKKNTELWTLDFFALLKKKLLPDGLILTYSSAVPVRSGFLKSGFHVYESEPVGRRRGGTITSLTELSDKKELLR